VDTTGSLAYWSPSSYVGYNDETLVKTPFCSDSVCTLDSQDLTVPTHLQDPFDQTVQHASLSLSTQQNLAALLRKNAKAFATSKLDFGYCADLQHDIDTGYALPIKQSPRIPPLSARQAEDDIRQEMFDTGVVQPSNCPWSSPVCMVRKKDDPLGSVSTVVESMPSLSKTHFLSLMLRTLSIVSAVLNTLLLLTYFQLTGNWGCQTEPASVPLSVRIEDFSSLLECHLA